MNHFDVTSGFPGQAYHVQFDIDYNRPGPLLSFALAEFKIDDEKCRDAGE